MQRCRPAAALGWRRHHKGGGAPWISKCYGQAGPESGCRGV